MNYIIGTLVVITVMLALTATGMVLGTNHRRDPCANMRIGSMVRLINCGSEQWLMTNSK